MEHLLLIIIGILLLIIFALLAIALIVYMLVRPYKESTKLEKNVKIKK